MGKLKQLTGWLKGEGQWLRGTGRALDNIGVTVGRWFSKNPANHKKLADAIPNLPAVYKQNPNRMVEWVKNNKINTAIIAYEVSELADLAFDLREENPEIFAILDTWNSDDTVDSIKLDAKGRQSREEARAAARKKALDDVGALSVTQLQAFKDEAAQIEALISGEAGILPGRSREQREAQLHLLRSVLGMPDTNFIIHETLRELGM